MTFKDIFKQSFLASMTTDLSPRLIFSSLLIASIFACYIFLVYRGVTRKTFYNNNFNISLAANTIIVTSIILAIQSSIVISLGMVGALSIVRFRTAIKSPMDLTFLFWSISVGIICGAQLTLIAIIASIILTIGILVLNAFPVAKAPLLLIINASDKSIRNDIVNLVRTNTNAFHIKSQTMESGHLDMIIEIRTSSGDLLLDQLSEIKSITRCTLVSHDGEVVF